MKISIMALSGSKSPSKSAIILTLLVLILITETVVMDFVLSSFPGLSPINSTLIDAALLTVVLGVALWYMLINPLHIMALSGSKFPSKAAVLFTLLVLILITETVVMDFVLSSFPGLSPTVSTIIDAVLLTVVLGIALWFMLIRPLHDTALQEHVNFNLIKSQVVDAVVTIDMNGSILSFNYSAEGIFGYAQEEVQGKPVGILSLDDFLLPKNLEQIDAVDGSSRYIHEVECHAKDGHALLMEISVSKLSYQGVEQYLIILRDIMLRKEAETALRESEKRFRQIFDQSEDAIIFFNPRTCGIIDVNKTAERLFGLSRKELLAKGLECPCFAESSEMIRSIISNITQGGGAHQDSFSSKKGDGGELILSIRSKLMVLQGCEVVYSTFRDISQRVRMEQEALQIQSRLIQANKMTSLGLMVSGVAHEVNNPNNFIMANAQLLDKAWTDAIKILRDYYRASGDFLLGGLPFSEMEHHLPEMISGISDGTKRIKSIIDDLKGFARHDSIDARDMVDINQVVKSAVSILHYEILNYTTKFSMNLGENLPAVYGNTQHLAQVVMNLIMNACQALHSTASAIQVDTSYVENEQYVKITVHDEGAGVPEELSKRILEPFFTTKLDCGGTGLGLSISMSIIREHGGTLEFESIPSKGTTFTVRLPVRDSSIEENA